MDNGLFFIKSLKFIKEYHKYINLSALILSIKIPVDLSSIVLSLSSTHYVKGFDVMGDKYTGISPRIEN